MSVICDFKLAVVTSIVALSSTVFCSIIALGFCCVLRRNASNGGVVRTGSDSVVFKTSTVVDETVVVVVSVVEVVVVVAIVVVVVGLSVALVCWVKANIGADEDGRKRP